MTFYDVYKKVVLQFSSDNFLEFYLYDKKICWSKKDFDSKVKAIASYLEKSLSNVAIGSYVGIKKKNHPCWFAVIFAIEMIGYSVILIDENASDELLQIYIEQSNMKGLISDCGITAEGVTAIDYDHLIELEGEAPINEKWGNRMAFCTSGTTGTAKIYIFSAAAILSQCINISNYIKQSKPIQATMNTGGPAFNKVLLTLPFRHCLGFGMPLCLWASGHPMVFPQKDGIYGIIESIKKEEIWFVCSVPAMWKGILRILKVRYGEISRATVDQLLGKKIRFGVSAGAKLPDTTINDLCETGIYFMNGWGMTEVGFSTLGCIFDDESFDYVGELYNKHRVRILTEHGQLLEEGTGELLVAGEVIYTSTLSKGQEIKRICDYEDYYRTGDLFQIKNGRFFFKGRIKSVIIGDNGENIYPEELDLYFSDLEKNDIPYCVAGYEDVPVMFLVADVDADFEESETYKLIYENNLRLPYYKRIKTIFVSKTPLPMTSKGEIARFKLDVFHKENSDKIKQYKLTKALSK